MLMLFCLLSLIFVASCQEQIAARPGTIDAGQQPEAYAGQAGELARNGNLHQGNFVIYCSSSWLVTARDSQIARLEQPGNTVSWLTGLKGSRLASHDRWLFYSGATAGSSTVRKVMPDGSNDVRISRASCQYLIADSQHLYAILNDSGQVVRFNHDGTGQQILFEGRATEMIYTQDALYVGGSDETTGLYRVDLQDGTTRLLLDKRVISLNKAGDSLYYISPDDQHRVNRWQLDNGQENRVTSFALARPFIIHDGWLYFIDSENQNALMRLPLLENSADEAQMEKVVDDAIGRFVLLPDAVFYQRSGSDRIYRVPLPHGPAQRVT